MRTLKISFLFFILTITISAQWSFNWVQRAGGNSDDSGQGISIDTSGSSYVTGSFRSTAMFGTIQLTSFGYTDIFIAKFNESGNCLWAKNVGSNYFDRGYGISTDPIGNSYVTGSFYGTVTFGTIQLTSFGNEDIFIAKYDSSGSCVWAKNAGGNDYDYGTGISVDADGNCYMTGYFEGTAMFGTTHLVSSGVNDVFVAKYDTNGNLIWAKNFGGSLYDYVYDYSEGISADPNGNIFITGRFVENPLPQYYDSDIFVVKYDAVGNLIWIKTVYGTSDDSGRSISADSFGNSYVTGHFAGFVDFGSVSFYSNGYQDIFIAKYDSNGNCIWAKNYGGSENDYARGISTNSVGNSYITGRFSGTVTFGTIHLTSFGNEDIFIAKYDSSGFCVLAKNAGGSLGDFGQSIVTDENENSYVTGYFYGSAMFDTTQLVSAGGPDIFITKLNTSVNAMEENLIPTEIQLHQNYPNPFNPVTRIQYAIGSRQFVTLKVFDLLGREIVTLVNEDKLAGEYEVAFNASNLPSGIYFCQLKAGDYSETKKMVLLK